MAQRGLRLVLRCQSCSASSLASLEARRPRQKLRKKKTPAWMEKNAAKAEKNRGSGRVGELIGDDFSRRAVESGIKEGKNGGYNHVSTPCLFPPPPLHWPNPPFQLTPFSEWSSVDYTLHLPLLSHSPTSPAPVQPSTCARLAFQAYVRK